MFRTSNERFKTLFHLMSCLLILYCCHGGLNLENVLVMSSFSWNFKFQEEILTIPSRVTIPFGVKNLTI